MSDYAHLPDSGFVLPQIRKVSYNEPVRWLGEGWGDLRQVPLASLAYGVCFAVGGWLMAWVFADAYSLFALLVMGFLILGPALAMGTYDLSRRLGRGEKPRFRDTVTAWRPNLANMGLLAAVLGVLLLLWARASMMAFAFFFDTGGLPTFADILRAIFAFEQPKFAIVYLGIAGLFAGLAFVVSVIALPMMLDRKVDAINAALASIAACARNPAAMLIWAGCIVSLIVGSLFAGYLGLVIVMPWLGHASWHAYRDLAAKPDDAGAALLK